MGRWRGDAFVEVPVETVPVDSAHSERSANGREMWFEGSYESQGESIAGVDIVDGGQTPPLEDSYTKTQKLEIVDENDYDGDEFNDEYVLHEQGGPWVLEEEPEEVKEYRAWKGDLMRNFLERHKSNPKASHRADSESPRLQKAAPSSNGTSTGAAEKEVFEQSMHHSDGNNEPRHNGSAKYLAQQNHGGEYVDKTPLDTEGRLSPIVMEDSTKPLLSTLDRFSARLLRSKDQRDRVDVQHSSQFELFERERPSSREPVRARQQSANSMEESRKELLDAMRYRENCNSIELKAMEERLSTQKMYHENHMRQHKIQVASLTETIDSLRRQLAVAVSNQRSAVSNVLNQVSVEDERDWRGVTKRLHALEESAGNSQQIPHSRRAVPRTTVTTQTPGDTWAHPDIPNSLFDEQIMRNTALEDALKSMARAIRLLLPTASTSVSIPENLSNSVSSKRLAEMVTDSMARLLAAVEAKQHGFRLETGLGSRPVKVRSTAVQAVATEAAASPSLDRLSISEIQPTSASRSARSDRRVLDTLLYKPLCVPRGSQTELSGEVQSAMYKPEHLTASGDMEKLQEHTMLLSVRLEQADLDKKELEETVKLKEHKIQELLIQINASQQERASMERRHAAMLAERDASLAEIQGAVGREAQQCREQLQQAKALEHKVEVGQKQQQRLAEWFSERLNTLRVSEPPP